MYESQFEQDLYDLRRQKLRQIAALGLKSGLTQAEAIYPNSYAISAPHWSETDGPLIPWLKQKYDSAAAPISGEQLESNRIEVSIAGRIMAIRAQGKAGFAQLQQGGQRLQIYVRKDDVGATPEQSEDAFALYKLLDLGDHIGVRGHLFRTRTGELTVHVRPSTTGGSSLHVASGTTTAPAITFLAKAMLALPDKYHGLEDTELRYRQRYVDLFMNTGHSPKPTTPPAIAPPTAPPLPASPQESVILSEAKNPRISSAAPHISTPTPEAVILSEAPAGSTAEGPASTPATDTPQAPTTNTVILSEAPAGSAPEGPASTPAADTPQTPTTNTVILSEAPAGSAAEGPASSTPEPLNVREVFVKRAHILRALRTFFDTRGYLEVETPMMHTVAGGAAARPFLTHHNALDLDLKLRIAPELYLKRLVVGGMDRVYEINRNFRNEGISTQHNPEFTMLEFYQAYSNYHDLMDLTQELITTVATEVNGTPITTFNGHEIDLSKWTKLSMREAIIKFWPTEFGDPPTSREIADSPADVVERTIRLFNPNYPSDPMDLDALTSKLSFSSLKKIAALEIAHRFWGKMSIGKVIAHIFESLAEEHLVQPTIIYDYPLAVSPLSKQKPDEPDWVERFEFYIGGFEIGNAFSELNDPDDQRARFAAQLLEKARGDEEAMAEVDEDYVRALGYGLPPTAGEGIGIDRLTMILTGSRSIRDVILFPLLRPQTKPTDKPNEL